MENCILEYLGKVSRRESIAPPQRALLLAGGQGMVETGLRRAQRQGHGRGDKRDKEAEQYRPERNVTPRLFTKYETALLQAPSPNTMTLMFNDQNVIWLWEEVKT